MFRVLFFIHNLLWIYKNINKEFWVPSEIIKKIMLGTPDAWSTSHLSQRTSKPVYYIVDCQIWERCGISVEKDFSSGILIPVIWIFSNLHNSDLWINCITIKFHDSSKSCLKTCDHSLWDCWNICIKHYYMFSFFFFLICS